MANDNKEIGDIVKKSKILLLDIEGTTTAISFVKDKLFLYVEDHVKPFLDSHWDKEEVKEAVSALRKLALEDQEKEVNGFVSIPGEDASKEDQIEGLVNNVKWQMSSDRKTGALKQLQGLIWKQGYDKGDIKGHVYPDVLPALEQWHSVEGQKVYIYSSGSVQAQKLLFGQSSAGDLLGYIDGHFDTAVGAKQEAASYTAITEKIGCKSDEILFLTDIFAEAKAAHEAGLNVALMSREDNPPLPVEGRTTFSVLHSFTQLTVTNKRKTEPQDELPAKVPKTEVENEVKTTSEPEPEKPKEVEEPEKMDVDEQTVNADKKTNEENKIEEVPVRIETVVEELPDNTPVDAPICDIEPVVIEENTEESNDKTEKKEETEKMITDSTETNTVEDTSVPKEKVEEKNNEEKAPPVAEETPPAVVTKIEEISDDKASLSEVAEIIDDLEPVVEEPPAVEEIEDLKNVGEVLEKECDEILSKVKNVVTNLDNIPLKPLLNPIPEEAMETDNVDSNDIVDRILDTELELEMKQSENIDLNTVAEITDDKKTEILQETSVKEDTATTEQKEVSKEIAAESNVENNVKEDKVEESSPMEIKTDNTETKMEKTDTKMENTEIKTEDTVTKTENTETKMENTETKTENMETKTDNTETKTENTEIKTEGTETKTEDTKTKNEKEEAKTLEPKSKEEPTKETTPADSETVPETKESDTAAEELLSESKSETELQVNGKATNGESDAVNVNGDASKDEELNARLSVENGKKQVNGSNGDSMETEQGQGESKVEPEVADIKVKTVSDVATDEPHTDPIEQPTEA